jgi:hypothetical protein
MNPPQAAEAATPATPATPATRAGGPMLPAARACASVAASAANKLFLAPKSAGFTGGYTLPRLSPLRQLRPTELRIEPYQPFVERYYG